MRRLLLWLLRRDYLRHTDTMHAVAGCVFCYMQPSQQLSFWSAALTKRDNPRKGE